MLIKSQLVTQISGSVGGLTGSHNKGGMYFRARTIPVNPASTFQVAVRNFMSQLVSAWQTTLTDPQRNGWWVYSQNVTKTNPLGDQVKVSGINWYAGANVGRLQAGQARVDDPPTTFNRGDFAAMLFTADATAGTADVTFSPADAWANEDEAFALIYFSRPMSPTINFFKGPYRLAGTIDGDSITPPTSPATIALPFPTGVGNVVFMKVVVVRADGRYSSPFRTQAIAT